MQEHHLLWIILQVVGLQTFLAKYIAMIKLKNKKHNHLLISATFLCCTYIFLVLFFFETNENETRYDNITTFTTVVFSAILLAPLIEETAFRLHLTNSKISQVISVLILITNIYLLKKQYVDIAIIYLICYYLFYKKFKIIRLEFILYFNAILFAILHYNISQIKSIEILYPIIMHVGLGLLLIWITINFGFKYSILTHFLINTTIITYAFITLQFVNTEKKTKIVEDYKLSWNAKPILNSKITYSQKNDFVSEAKNITPIQFLSFFKKDVSKFRNVNMFKKFDITLERNNFNAKKIDSLIATKILLDSKLIFEVKKINRDN